MKVEELFEGEVIYGKFGKKSEKQAEVKKTGKLQNGTKKISGIQAFGSSGLIVLEKLGYHLMEKPSYWEELQKSYENYKPISANDLPKIKRAFKENDLTLNMYDFKEFFPFTQENKLPKTPQTDILKSAPKDQTFILSNEKGTYLCDRTGASSYIRFWARIY